MRHSSISWREEKRFRLGSKMWRGSGWKDAEAESNVQFGEGGPGPSPMENSIPAERSAHLRHSGNLLPLRRPSRNSLPPAAHIERTGCAGGDQHTSFLEEQGVEFKFQAKVTSLEILHGKLQRVIVNGRDEMEAPLLLLALGHSAGIPIVCFTKPALLYSPNLLRSAFGSNIPRS